MSVKKGHIKISFEKAQALLDQLKLKPWEHVNDAIVVIMQAERVEEPDEQVDETPAG